MTAPRVTGSWPWFHTQGSATNKVSSVCLSPPCRLLLSGVWCLMSDVWCLASGVWRLVSGVWRLVSGVWRLVSDVWCLVSGVWRLVSGVWCLRKCFGPGEQSLGPKHFENSAPAAPCSTCCPCPACCPHRGLRALRL